MTSWLIVEEGMNLGGSFHLRQGVLTVGRGPANPIQIVHPSVSRRHAQFRLAAHQYVLTDLYSRNGTYVNGKRITDSTPLKNGDVIQFGDIVTLYLVGRPPADQPDLVQSWKKSSDTTRIARTTVMKAAVIDGDLTEEVNPVITDKRPDSKP